MGKLNLDRRKFLKTLFLSSLCNGLSIPTFANPSKTQFNYLQINFAGGPARWLFDNPVAPFKDSGFVPNEMIVNEFTNKGQTAEVSSLKYKRVKVNGHIMPAFWEEKLKLSKGMTSASNLLDNALIVRGCHMKNDGHALNNRKLSAPIPGHESIPGLLADKHGDFLFPAVNIVGDSGIAGTAAGAFKGSGDSIQVDIPQNHDAPLEHLLTPYLKLKNSDNEWSDIIESELGNSYKLDFLKIVQEYKMAVTRYRIAIDHALKVEEFGNIGERYVNGINRRNLTLNGFTKEEAKYLNHDYLICNKDFRSILKTAKIEKLAEQFATAELLLTEGLSGNICINVNTITNLFYENSYEKDQVERIIDGVGDTKFKFNLSPNSYTGSRKANSFQLDSHDTGLLPNLFLNYALYKAVSSGIAELKNALIKAKVFDKTLIHIASEFDRDPRPDCSGSEHGWNGHLSTFISGSIQGMKVIGNTYVQSHKDSFYKKNGTWGQGAPLKELGNRPMVYGNIASSLADVLGVKSPTRNDKPVFTVKRGKIVPLIDEAKNIEV